MKLLCINDSFNETQKKLIPNRPILGEIYTLREVRKEFNGKDGILLEELKNPFYFYEKIGDFLEASFDPNRFIEWNPEELVEEEEAILEETI